MAGAIVKAVRVQSIGDAFNKPGHFVFVNGYTGMAISCPGCGQLGTIDFTGAGRGHSEWEWDTHTEAPTLTPSLDMKDACCGWHGFLTAGEFKPC